ncbi:class I adenylate-forming enzyme family protein [Solidesulfovibrio sp.]|uniref:class I adenylate-forming enzyme family protein n=1 Tax=Solidesulfovibrio sp. TaxID=2910990 RepID=UPI0026017CD2|nr:class I adenylate-forming enzyme family protein [Solidesulfovibrio sp.]
MLVTEILARNARMYPEEIALIERCPKEGRRKEITWSEFDQQADRVAGHLAAKGLAKGDRVLILLENCLEWLPVYFGVLRAGCLVVPVDYSYADAALAHCLNLSGATAICYGSGFRPLVERLRRGDDRTLGVCIEVGPNGAPVADFAEDLRAILDAPARAVPPVPLGILDAAALYFTSGSTGRPKAALLTHRNLEFACYLENSHHRQTHADNFLCLLPLFHAGAVMHWFGGFIVGAKAVILNSADVPRIFEAISEEGVTIVWFVVPLAKEILCQIEGGKIDLAAYRLGQWRLMHIGAQPISPSLINEWRSIFPDHLYNTTYGLTETTGPGCIQLGINNFHKVGAIGRPGFDWEVRIVDASMAEVPQGKAGRLIVKGPGVMREYYRDPEATERHLRDGWFLTGDIAMRDEDGFIWYVDREDDVIHVGEYDVFPVEIENFLLLHQRIQDAAVFGLGDGAGQVVAALIQSKPGHALNRGHLEDFCQAMPAHKRPSLFFFGDVPRGLTGKIRKFFLKTHYGPRLQDGE